MKDDLPRPEGEPARPYRHTQAGTIIRVLLGAMSAYLVVMYFLLEGELLGRAIVVIVLAVVVLALALFHSLTISVDRTRVEARFGPGWPRFSWESATIRGVRRLRSPWYLGWGIRWFPGGWLYNVSGFDAVELELESGRRVRLGTDEPERLLAALEDVIDRRDGA